MPSEEGWKNLIPSNRRTPEELRELTTKAGVASGKARRLKRLQRDILREILALQVTEDEVRDKLEEKGLDPDYANAINLAVVNGAMKGDVESTRYIRDTIGEKPREAFDMAVSDKPVAAMDLAALSDAELEALIDKEAENRG